MGLKIKNSKNIVTDGLILHLDASDKLSYSSGITWKDRSPNGYNGTLNNGPSFFSSNGGVIDFDGTNNRVNIWNSPLLSSHSDNETSVCAWVRVESFTGSPIVYLRRDANFRDCIRLGVTTDGEIQVNLRLLAGGVTGTDSFTSVSTVSLNAWILVCFTYDGFHLKMYKDGNSFHSVSYTATLQDSSSNGESIIGADQDTTSYNGFNTTTHNQFLNGRVGELYCYNKALTASEMKQMYNTTKGRFSV
jgi:hypothetical protein